MAKKLRFAALIRVSTEKQEKQGTSLTTQKADNQRSVKYFGGTIVEWYGGQEHATAGWEKKEVDRLLMDATRGRFDAVIIAYADRWSRDNAKSKEGLEILRRNKIRFFVGSTEYDLFNPEHKLLLGMSAEFGEFQASQQNKKSILNRIEKARLGIPTVGKLPYGRLFDRKTNKWKIDPKKQKIILDVAKRYLAGESLYDLAEEYDINNASLNKTLQQRCGTEWTMEFDAPELNIHEEVTIQIPPLLSPAMIKALKARAKANRTFLHKGVCKYPYLFGRFVFCAHCGAAMNGQTNHKKKQYYRHRARSKCNMGGVKAWVNAGDLDDVVIRHLFECFGNPAAVQRAVEQATPNHDKIRELRERYQRFEDDLAKIKTGRSRILDEIVADTISKAAATEKLLELKEREEKIKERLQHLEDSIGDAPSDEMIKQFSENVARNFKQRRQYSSPRLIAKKNEINADFEGMTWQQRRSLVETVFSGKLHNGKRMGIYISWVDGEKARGRRKKWKYEIQGHFIRESAEVPMTEQQMNARFIFGDAAMQHRLVTINACP